MGEIKKQILLRRASINAPVGAGQEHASIRMHCLFGARPSTSSPVEPMGSDIHPHIHTQSFTYPPPGLGLNRPAFLTTFTQWSECTKPSGEIQSVCETERHKCRFGCASCKQNKERPFTFSGLFEMPGMIWMSLFPILHGQPHIVNLCSSLSWGYFHKNNPNISATQQYD